MVITNKQCWKHPVIFQMAHSHLSVHLPEISALLCSWTAFASH